MIRWCSYCSTYRGESAPFDNYEITHGICTKCKDELLSADDFALSDRSRLLTEFFKNLNTSGPECLSATRILEASTGLGIRPIDLLFGMIQPTLYEVGKRWATGELTVAQEHQLSAVYSSVLELAWGLYSDKLHHRSSKEPLVVLCNAENNYHTLGIRFLEILLAAEGIPNYVNYPGMPTGETIALVQGLKPKFLGISISMATQLDSVRELSVKLQELRSSERPQLILGGFPIRTGQVNQNETISSSEIRSINDPEEFLKLVKAAQ